MKNLKDLFFHKVSSSFYAPHTMAIDSLARFRGYECNLGNVRCSIIGLIVSVGISCATFGITLDIDLAIEMIRSLITAKSFLLSTLYNMHFIIEHNRGHHRNVATDKDLPLQ